jgi:hypothetical protein
MKPDVVAPGERILSCRHRVLATGDMQARHYVADQRLRDVGFAADVVARARSLALIRIKDFVSVDDRRIELARKAGLDGLRIVGVRPRP